MAPLRVPRRALRTIPSRPDGGFTLMEFAGCYCHYRDPGGHASAGIGKSQNACGRRGLHEQHKATRPGLPALRTGF